MSYVPAPHSPLTISLRTQKTVKLAPSKFTIPNRRAVASLAFVTVLSALEKQRQARNSKTSSGEEPTELETDFAAQDMSGELQTIPARHGVATYVPKGRTIKIINTYGKQVVSTWAFSLGAPPEEGEEEADVEGLEDEVGELKEELRNEGEEGEEQVRQVEQDVEKPKDDVGEAKDTEGKAQGKEDVEKSKVDADETAETKDTEDNDDPPEQAPDTPENEKATPNKDKTGKQKRTWASYIPSIPYRNKNKNQDSSGSKPDAKPEKDQAEATSKKWSSYLPTGKGFATYVPNVQLPDKENVISAFQSSHYRDPNKSYAEQLYDFSKTPVGAGGIAAATGSGTASSLYAAYNAYAKMNPAKADQPPMEYLSLPHTRAFSNRLVPNVDDTLLTNLRNPIMTLVEDTSPGAHDTLTSACDASLYAALGVEKPEEHGSCAENLVLALKELNGKAGLKGTKAVGADITVNIAPTPLHLFMNAPLSLDEQAKETGVGAKGASFSVEEPAGKKRSYVRFRAERDIVVVLSTCPMDVGKQNGGKCMAANFMVEDAEEELLAASTPSVKKAPRKLGKKDDSKKDDSKKDESKDKAEEKKDEDKPKPKMGMPRLRGGPAKIAAVKKSAEDARKGGPVENDDDPAESEIPNEGEEGYEGSRPEEEKTEEPEPEEASAEEAKPEPEPEKSSQKEPKPEDAEAEAEETKAEDSKAEEQTQKEPKPVSSTQKKSNPDADSTQKDTKATQEGNNPESRAEEPKPKKKPKKLERRSVAS